VGKRVVSRADATVAADERSAVAAVIARAARVGVTPEKVLREYAHIAFADLRHIVELKDGELHVKGKLRKADAAPISEVLAGNSGRGPVKVKLYDKKAALDVIARYLGMFGAHEQPHENENWDEAGEDPREILMRELDRLAAEEPPS
jgi:terminase small subunit-like protein